MNGKKKEVRLTNEHGEVLTLILDNDNNIWFRHEDINTEFEDIKAITKYVFNDMEKTVIKQFVVECKTYV